MLYSTIVQRDEEGFDMIYKAAIEFEELNAMEAIVACKFDLKKVEQTLNLVRMYQARLNIESMDLVEFSENFIEQYATDHNECFRIAEKLIRRIGTTITGSMKIFRKFCPVVRRKLDKFGNVVPALAGFFAENIDTIVDAVDDDLAEFALRCEFEVGP